MKKLIGLLAAGLTISILMAGCKQAPEGDNATPPTTTANPTKSAAPPTEVKTSTPSSATPSKPTDEKATPGGASGTK